MKKIKLYHIDHLDGLSGEEEQTAINAINADRDKMFASGNCPLCATPLSEQEYEVSDDDYVTTVTCDNCKEKLL